MTGLNYLAIVVAAIAVFVFAAVYYSVLAGYGASWSAAWAAKPARPPAWQIFLELVKALVVASVIAGMVELLGIDNLAHALLLGAVLWIAFPVVLLTGSVTHENVPWQLAAIHAGDWLAKLLIIAVIVCLWR
jgi:hypothetical protein